MKRAIGGTALLLAVLAAGWAGAAALRGEHASAALGDANACAAYNGLPAGWGQSPDAGMVRVTTTTGRAFRIDATEVTRAQFAAFVDATGYRTQAERGGDVALFEQLAPDAPDISPQAWWRHSRTANWKQAGTRSDHEPVTLVTRADAQAYALWLGHRLPTEAEWEAAAHGARELDDRGKAAANFWQGFFPIDDRAEDGHHGLAPVGCYRANAQGLYDSIGNVWEWTADDWSGSAQAHGHGAIPGAQASTTGVIKGGSWLCAANYCQRYRDNARHPQDAALATVHVGFRTVRDE